MTLNALAHEVRETLQSLVACEVPHSHVHELLAAALAI